MKPSTSSEISERRSASPDAPTMGTNPLYEALRERRASYRPQPLNTVLYEVTKCDTLSSIAARFNTTPSDLALLNKLGCRTIFPSQIIYVPDTSGPSLQRILDSPGKSGPLNGQQSPKPGHVQRIDITEDEKSLSPSAVAEDLNKLALSKFLKINARNITDGEGVVGGVLLVTPNHLMFDPNVSDPLVIEHGIEKYGVVAPIHMVVRTALYTDIVRMKTKCGVQTKPENSSLKLYHAHRLSMKKSLSTDDFISQANKNSASATEYCSVSQKKLSRISEHSFDKSDEEVGEEDEEAKDDNDKEDAETDCHPVSSLQDLTTDDPLRLQKDSEPPSSDEDKKSGKAKDKHHKGLFSQRRLSLPISTSFQELKLKMMPSTYVKKSKTKEDKPKVDTPPSTSYQNMVDEMPDFFATVDKLMPRPAKSFDDNPLYLCLRMGQPINVAATKRVTPIMNYGKQLKSEYWFSIPRVKVDSLYWFLLRWAPDRYGEVYDIDLENMGFSEVCEDEEDIDSPPPTQTRNRSASWAFPWRRRKSQDVSEKSLPVSWEFVQKEEEAEESPGPTPEPLLPELLSSSDIMTDEHIQQLNEYLPARAIGYSWCLIYSTSLNGFSLKTLYREMAQYQSPVLIVIASTTGTVFGTMLSSPLKMSDHFYGTGESFLFSFFPEFKVYNWSGENAYFIKGNTASFAVGASDGQFGLWIDDDLFHGCSKECRTFSNPPLSDQEDFIIKTLEAWAFV